MSVRSLFLALLLVACGFGAGLVITNRFPGDNTAAPQAVQAPGTAPVAAGEPGAPAPLSPPMVAAPGGEPAALVDFSRIAERTVPAVVNISSLQVVRRPNSPFANDPFFRQFFGDDEMFGSRRSVESSLGSGVIVSEDGYILTNNHVVAGESGRLSLRQLPDITVALADRREVPAEIVGVDPDTDLALLKVNEGGLATIPWGDSTRLKVAEWVLAIGNPFQLNQTVTLGIVSALGRTNVGISMYEDFIQTDAAINPGNSGGALVNSRGELVGINTAIFSQSGGYQGIGFAVPSHVARRVVSDLQQFGEVRRGSIGVVEIGPVTSQIAEQAGAPDTRGVVVGRMRRDSSAYEAGLRPLDIIIRFNGTPVTDGGHLIRLIADSDIGSTATVAAIRNSREIELQIPIARR
jgi:Do/DeqQ family serine protease